MKRPQLVVPALGLVFLFGCGGDDAPGLSLDDVLPQVPAPTGEAQTVWAGPITTGNADELIDGPAASGMAGDFYMRNARGRYVIQAPARVIGAVPQGGNLVDAVPLGPDGLPRVGDHFGELSFLYVLGRTCEHQGIEVVHDGSGGGAAVVRARGRTAANDFLNFRGLGLFDIPPELDADLDDGAACATTYVLAPDAPYLRVMWTLFNPGDTPIHGPIGVFNDTGGEVGGFSPTRGFERLGLGALSELTTPVPIPYTLYQGPGVAYGILPRHDDPETQSAAFLISGVSIMVFGAETLLDILDDEAFHLDLPAQSGVTYTVDLAVATDAAGVEEIFRTGRGEAVAEVSGRVTWSHGAPVEQGARVGLYRDTGGDGALGPDDVILTYMDAGADGRFAGRVPPGRYLARAEVRDVARSEAVAVEVTGAGVTDLALSLPAPVHFDYEITDDTGTPMPGRLTVIGRHPVGPDSRLVNDYDRAPGTVRMVHAVRGTTVDIGDGADPRLVLPAGATYRIYASRGTEWSVASQEVEVAPGDPDQSLTFELHRVAPADGYVASEYHVHQIGSPDSPVSNERRVASMVAEGVELFASTDHDYVSDLQPVIEALGLAHLTRNIPGIEVTPFAYGHFNAWPIEPDPTSPNFGAIDWARGTAGYAMIPGEIFDAMRDRGAELVQVNHPRSTLGGALAFMQYFDRAGLQFDYQARQITGDLAAAPVPNAWLRLPEESLWDDTFNALEVWNRLDTADSNEDGVREIAALDVVMRDWFNFLTLGLVVTPMGNSDTHQAYRSPAGIPRTYVRVGDDSPQALESGAIVADTLATLTGTLDRDVVVTNGPHIRVARAGQPGSVLGAVIDGTTGSVTLDIEVLAPAWAEIDTLEIFANATPDVNAPETALQPLYCATSRPLADLADNDVCALAPRGPEVLDVQRETVAPGVTRYRAALQVTMARDDIVHPPGATGDDAWLVVRVRGQSAIFPLLTGGVVTGDTIDILVSGTEDERRAVTEGVGVPATAFTSPVFVDFDGGGYTPVLSPLESLHY